MRNMPLLSHLVWIFFGTFLILTACQHPLQGDSKLELNAGKELDIRLKTAVSSSSSKVNDRVEAVVIAPAGAANQVVVPAGALVNGVVKSVTVPKSADERALLLLEFNELVDATGKKVKLEARLSGIDNARESVDEKGQIIGIVQSETISSRLDDALNKLKDRYQGLADILETAKHGFMKETQPDINYAPGVEMTLKLTNKIDLDSRTSPTNDPVQQDSSDPALIQLANSLPFRTQTEATSEPSDLTNLMFLGSKEQLESAFNTAGWSTAAALNRQSQIETARAIAEDRGYKEAPVSVLLLDGHKPDIVFEKQNNTFAKRYHLWFRLRAETFQGKSVWVSAATHDIGIDFSPEKRTFIHKIDSNIDRERSKVGNDLLFTSKPKSLGLVYRPNVPKDASNATGDKLLTDGKMLVLEF